MTGSVIYTRLDPGEPAEVGLAAQERAIGGFLEQRSDAAPVVGRFCDAGPEGRAAAQMRGALVVARIDWLPLGTLGLAPFFANPGLVLRVASLPDEPQDALWLYVRLHQQERAFHERQEPPVAHRPARDQACDLARDRQMLDEIAPVILPLCARGATLRDMASALNRIGLTTRRGTALRANHIARALMHLENESPAQPG